MTLANPLLLGVIFLVSASTCYVLFQVGLRLYKKWGLLDNPGPYWHKREPVPLGFGLILYINFLIVSLLFVSLGLMELTGKLIILQILGAVITFVSFYDDLDTIFKFDRDIKGGPKLSAAELSQVKKTRFAISARTRLFIQIAIGAIIGLTSIKISYISNIFGGILHLDFFSFSVGGFEVFVIPLLFTVFWFVLVFNSVNWSDGIPGLTIGLTTITMIVIAVLTVRFYLLDETPALRENAVFVFGVLAIVIPSLLLAWYYNLTPKILLGDSGTMFIAFLIASLAILVGGKVATVATALGVYLVDAIYVIFARILNRQNPLKGDRIHHLHYRLQAMGMSDSFIRRLVYSVAVFFGIAAAFLDKTGKILLFVALIIVIVFITKILSLKK